MEDFACKKLGLAPAPASSQVVQRDRHAELFTTLALLGSSVEKFAVEIRHLQRTEVREVEEPFAAGQKGSSAMPHKRNPILSENLTGLARLLRGYALQLTLLEDVAPLALSRLAEDVASSTGRQARAHLALALHRPGG